MSGPHAPHSPGRAPHSPGHAPHSPGRAPHSPGAGAPHGGEDALSLSFKAELGLVEGILVLVDEWAAERGVFKDDRISLRLVLEELLLNLCLHAGRDAEGAETQADLAITPIRAQNGGTGEPSRHVHRLAVTLRDTGREFNPLHHEPEHAESIRDARIGGRGLTLVRLLAPELEYARKHGNNILKLTLACAGPGKTPLFSEDAAGRPVLAQARSGGVFRTLARLWHGMLAVRQTVFFFCIFTAMVWGGLLFYYQAASYSRQENAGRMCRQALHTQNFSSSTFLELLAGSFAEFLAELAEHPDFPAILASDGVFFDELRDGVLLRSIMADTAVLGVLKGKTGKAGAMLLYRAENAVNRLFLPLDFDAFVEQSSRGGQSVWAGPIRTLPAEAAQGHAGMLLAKTMNGEGDWIGIVITMPWILATLDTLTGFENVASAFITNRGEYVAYPPGRNVRGGPQGLADEVEARAAGTAKAGTAGSGPAKAGTGLSPEMARLIARIENREAGTVPLESLFPGGVSPWPFSWEGPTTLAYAPMTVEGWGFLLFVSSVEIGATAPSLPSGMVILAVLAPFFAGLAAWKISSGVVRPLGRLSGALDRIADGDLDTPLPVPEKRDEISGMLRAFEHVRITLKHSFATLAEATAAEQRMRNELALARAIQESMLPASAPDVPGIGVAMGIDMAGEVCGDLYDCFTLPGDPQSLYCLIGDVCGKGVPASVIMSRTMVLARSFLLSGAGCAETLARLNEALLRSDDSLMFVTLLVARLDGKTGELTWASAGHPPPMPGPEPGASARPLPAPLPWSRELALGVKPGRVYTERRLRLARGQSVLLYTDGADEAMAPGASDPAAGQSEGREIFGEERLLAAFADACAGHRDAGAARSGETLRRVRASLLSHMGGAAPFDDISLIVIRRDGDGAATGA